MSHAAWLVARLLQLRLAMLRGQRLLQLRLAMLRGQRIPTLEKKFSAYP
jgi:hypothetical protein